MKKAVLQLGIREKRIRKKVFVKISSFSGINSIALDDKTGKMTIIGEIDVSVIVMKLRKICDTKIVSVDDVKPGINHPLPQNPQNQQYQQYLQNQQYQQYQTSYPSTYYQQPYNNYYPRVVYDEPQGCVIM